MTDQDELAELEAERDRLRSLMAYYEQPEIGFPELPLWFCYVLLGAGCIVAASALVIARKPKARDAIGKTHPGMDRHLGVFAASACGPRIR